MNESTTTISYSLCLYSIVVVVVVVVYFSTNLMVCISSLTTIARHRPGQMLTVIQSFELLFANLPPNFTRAQVSSVRKFLKVLTTGTKYSHLIIGAVNWN